MEAPKQWPPLCNTGPVCKPFIETEAFTALKQLIESQSIIVIAVTQMGGMGKTQLARYCARQRYTMHLEQNDSIEKPSLVWELQGNDFTQLSNGFRSLAQSLNLDGWRADQTAEIKNSDDLERLCSQIYSSIEQHYREAILILDDAFRFAEEQEEFFGIQPYLPSFSKKIRVVITSRQENFFGYDESYETFNLKTNYFEHAAKPLTIKINSALENDPLLEKLLKRLGYLPLAINLIAHYSKHKNKTCAQLLSDLDEKEKFLDDRLFKEIIKKYPAYNKTVYATLLLPIKNIINDPEKSDVWELLVFASFIEHENIDENLFKQYLALKYPECDRESLEEKLEDIQEFFKDYSLLQYSFENKSYSIHQLLQDVVRDQYKISNQSTALTELNRIIICLNDQLKEKNEYTLMREQYNLIKHSDNFLKYLTRDFKDIQSLELIDILDQTASTLIALADQKCLAQAVDYYRYSLIITEKKLGREHQDFAISHNNLAYALQKLGGLENLREAEKLLRYAIRITQDSYSKAGQHDNLANTLEDLGGQKNIEEAMQLRRAALKLIESLNVNDDLTVRCYNNLAEALRSSGLAESRMEALLYYQKALDILVAMNGEDVEIAKIINNMGLIFHSMRALELAIKCYKNALLIANKQLGDYHPLLASIHNNLGTVYHDNEELEKSIEHHENALNIRKQDNNPLDLALTYNNLGLALQALNSEEKLEEAIEYLRLALKIRQEQLTPLHHHVANSYYRLANALFRRDFRDDEALNHAQNAIDIAMQVWGEYHEKTKQYQELLKKIQQKQTADKKLLPTI